MEDWHLVDKRAYNRMYYAKNRSRILSGQIVYKRKNRAKAIELLGGCCSECGDSRTDVLQFDHIEPVGQNRPTRDTYDEVLKCVDPSEVFQLLCANCHVLKTRNSGEYRGRGNILNSETREDRAEDSQLVLF